jgi:hypothetical protein
MIVTIFQVNVLCEEGLSFSPFGETGEGFVVSPSPRLRRFIGVSVCPFAKHPCGAPKGDGMVTSPFLRGGLLSFQMWVRFQKAWASPPWGTRTRAIASGRRERGFVRFLPHPDSDGFSSGRIPPLPAGEGRVRVDSVSKDSFSCKLFYSLFNSKNAGL